MVYTETKTTWYFSRIWNSIKGILFWIILIIGSVILLWWNEGRTIDIAKWLSEWEKITVNGIVSPLDNSLDWKLIHISWEATTDDILKDNTFFIEKNAIKLIREVEMYQWKENSKTETRDNLWGSETKTTTYTYEKIWDDKKISSSSFKESWHENPNSWQYESQTNTSNNVFIWDLKLSSPFVSQFNKKEQISLTEENYNVFKNANSNLNSKLLSGIIYIWNWNLSAPQIWDLKVTFYWVYPSIVSVIWKQENSSLNSYKTKTDTSINLFQYLEVSKEEMYQKAKSDNKIMAWIIRWWGLLLMFIGFNMVFWIFVIIAKVIPFLSSIVWFWTGLISFFLTLIVWWWTIIIAWFFVRPLLSISLIILIAIAIFWIIKLKKQNIQEKV